MGRVHRNRETMQTEGVGGPCPRCGWEKCFIKKGTGTWFTFIACPKCRFAYGENADNRMEETDGIVSGADVWQSVMAAFKPDSYEKFMNEALEFEGDHLIDSPFKRDGFTDKELDHMTIGVYTARALFEGVHEALREITE